MNESSRAFRSFRICFGLLAACAGLSASACAGGDEVSARGLTLPVAVVQGNEADCTEEAWRASCGERGGIGSICDSSGAPLCCFEADNASALCVEDEGALDTTTSPLVVGGTTGGGGWEISTCQYKKVCYWVCDPPEHDDDIYHCRLLCTC